jgi:hypothetical protein
VICSSGFNVTPDQHPSVVDPDPSLGHSQHPSASVVDPDPVTCSFTASQRPVLWIRILSRVHSQHPSGQGCGSGSGQVFIPSIPAASVVDPDPVTCSFPVSQCQCCGSGSGHVFIPSILAASVVDPDSVTCSFPASQRPVLWIRIRSRVHSQHPSGQCCGSGSSPVFITSIPVASVVDPDPVT